MPTTNLNLDTVAENQANKNLTINSTIEKIEDLLTENIQIDIDNTDTVTLTNSQFRQYFHFTFGNNGINAAGTVNVPAIKRGLFFVYNNTGQTITIQKVSGQSVTAPTLTNGSRGLFTMDGSNVFAI